MFFLKTIGKKTILISENIPLVLAIGIFDGIHLGHERVIQSAVEAAKAIGGKVVVYTFSPHPTEILGNRKNLILTRGQKFIHLSRLGVDYMIEQHFDEEFASLQPEDFVNVLNHKFKTIKMICIGQNFRFGNKRAGDAYNLESICSNNKIKVTIIQPLMANGARISSSRIRQELIEGNIAAANSMLGYNYYCECVFESDQQIEDISVSILEVQNEQQIRTGIYQVNMLNNNEIHHGIADYHIDNQTPRLDIHLFENKVIPSNNMAVEFLSYIRERMSFSTLNQRNMQIKKDVDMAKNLTYKSFLWQQILKKN
jgi:riboflavin kinase/FMN adenylyltransferase